MDYGTTRPRHRASHSRFRAATEERRRSSYGYPIARGDRLSWCGCGLPRGLRVCAGCRSGTGKARQGDNYVFD